MSVNNVAV